MSPRPKVRVMLRDPEAGDPEQVRVILRQRVIWVILAGAFLGVLLLPRHRRMFLDQAGVAWWGRSAPWADPGEGSHRHCNRILAELAKAPGDARLHLGAIDSVLHTAGHASSRYDVLLTYLESLRARYPGDPVVLAALLRHSWRQVQPALRARESGNPTRPGFESGIQEFTARAEEGSRLDPHNGFFPTMLAVARFAAGQEEEGYREMRHAAALSKWNDYSAEESKAARELLFRTYGDAGLWMHARPRHAVLLPHLDGIRRSGRLAIRYAEQIGAAGNCPREHGLRADLIRVGMRIRETADPPYSLTAGAALEDYGMMGLGGTIQNRGTPEHWAALQRRLIGRYVDRLEREAPERAALVREEQAAVARFWERWHADHPYRREEVLFDRASRRDVIGLELLASLAPVAILWILSAAAGLGLAWLGRRGGWRWLWQGTPLFARAAALFFVPLGLAASLPVAGEFWASGGWLLPLGLFWIAILVGDRVRLPGPAMTGILGFCVLLAAALFPWQITDRLHPRWEDFLPGSGMLLDPTLRYVLNPFSSAVLHEHIRALGFAALLLLALFAVAIAAWRRIPVIGSLTRAARILTGLLAASYLVYLLVAVPANYRDARIYDELVRQERQAYQVR